MIKENKGIIIMVGLSSLIICAMHSFELLDNNLFLNDESRIGFYWNMITINSVFAGFMFSTLGIIFSVLEAPIIKKLEKGTIIDRIYLNLIRGIYSSIVSIIFSFLFIIVPSSLISEYVNLANFVSLLILIISVFTIICFIKSVSDVNFIIKTVRYNVKNSGMKKEHVDEALERIKLK